MKVNIEYVEFEIEHFGYLINRLYLYETMAEANAGFEGLKSAFYHNNSLDYFQKFKERPKKMDHFLTAREQIAFYNAATDAERSYGFTLAYSSFTTGAHNGR